MQLIKTKEETIWMAIWQFAGWTFGLVMFWVLPWVWVSTLCAWSAYWGSLHVTVLRLILQGEDMTFYEAVVNSNEGGPTNLVACGVSAIITGISAGIFYLIF